ncbi:pectate lyase [Pelagicoccus sp. SDUM812003]|uniref:pectate lyase n=1 Tax=Pelagicoccus sp. SDUM812003 TaxID=3041267 RepID=UPI0028109679|nr:pectate lyase [Pelagicoccus sp. SDUM812003]MDQ8201629.1 pectate lyase [Pelagicoccus sp. SDUM812003]
MRLLPYFIFAISLCQIRAEDIVIPIDGFSDAIHHWQNRHGDDYPRHALNDIEAISDNLLLYQRSNGGWKENEDPLRILSSQERLAILDEKQLDDTSFDNRNTYSQIEYLAHAYQALNDERYRKAVFEGLRFILEAQLASGGFTHSPPRNDSYRGHITFADEVMPGVLSVLKKVRDAAKPFEWIEDRDLIEACGDAVEKGERLMLDLQVVQDGKRTAWAGQYDVATLQPTRGRSFELPSIVAWESVAVVEYLMRIENPDPEVVDAIEGAIDWFQRSALSGIRIERPEIEPVPFTYHTATVDPRLVSDADAPPIWARFYDLNTNQPILATRKGQRVSSYAEISLERRSGYAWYGYWPRKLLERDYPRWKRELR